MNTARRTLAAALHDALGGPVEILGRRNVHGGSIHRACRYDTSRGPIFIKIAPSSAAPAFAAEAAGLAALAAAQAARVPTVLASGLCEEGAFVALEWIELGAASRSSHALLGERLAWQHRVTHKQFGWDRDNTIGATPQVNTGTSDWIAFYREHRLRYQLALARTNGAGAALLDAGERLSESLGAFFTSYQPRPSLLHGDLWGGNWGADADGMPVIFDPAVYYGDREADIAMTRLFGGFGPAFYAAYQSTWPLDSGARDRTALYNLYHVLNHFNIFGGAYQGQAQALVEEALALLKG